MYSVGLVLVEAAVLILLVGWIGYPMAIYCAARLRARAFARAVPGNRAVSLIIATREPIAQVQRRLENLEELHGELRDLEVIVAVDPTGPIRVDAYRAALGDQAKFVEGDLPGGKATTLNAGVRAASHEILAFTDTAQQFLPHALSNLILPLDDRTVGAVTGQLQSDNNSRSLILSIFWAYESTLRALESSFDSIVAVTGALYALRRELWEPLPDGLICDDLYVPLRVVQKGSRVVTCDTARAVDSRVFTPAEEYRRKVRTLTGMLQLCALRPSILNPFRNRIWPQFVCHKLLRIITPYALLLGALGVALLLPAPVVLAAAITAAACLGVAHVAASRFSLVARVLHQASWAALILVAPLAATVNAVRGNWNVWSTPARRQE